MSPTKQSLPTLAFNRPRPAFAALLLLAAAAPALAQTPTPTTFTYQGRLLSAGQPVTGVYDLRFRLYDIATGETPLGLTQCRDNVTVTNGNPAQISLFTTTLNAVYIPRGM